MDNDGEVFQKQAFEYQALLDTAINFIVSKGLYDEYMEYKQNQKEGKN